MTNETKSELIGSITDRENDVLVLPARRFQEIRANIKRIFNHYENLVPVDRGCLIVIKPNLNSNMNALTGNTTDLRILSGIVQELQSKGYKNIVIAEGTNSGFYRQGIDVITRLRVQALASHFGVQARDTNHDEQVSIPFEGGVSAGVAKTFVEADFFINVPKIKMHYETQMSVCLKSLVGALVGMENKKKTHSSLIKNICNLNESIRPHLQIVDGIIAMEGNGPTTGTPAPLGVMLAGTNPYRLDMIASKLVDSPMSSVPVLVEASRRGRILQADYDYVDDYDLGNWSRTLVRPNMSLLTKIFTHKKLQKYFLRIRHAPLIRNLFNSPVGNKLLFKLKLTQEIMIYDEPNIVAVSHDTSKCDDCGICAELCPLGNDPRNLQKKNGCVKCLYCFAACPNHAFEVDGDLGFFEEQINQYDALSRTCATQLRAKVESK
jgi:uncharacterized protein (DUF362 family)/ferredoxin